MPVTFWPVTAFLAVWTLAFLSCTVTRPAAGAAVFPAASTFGPNLLGRPVRVVSLSFRPGRSLTEILSVVESQAQQGTDLIVLPETWLGQNDQSMEPEEGRTVRSLAGLSKKYHTYILTPLDVQRADGRFNSAILIDRAGRIVGRYDKVFPYWSEYDLQQPVVPGRRAPVFEADFGRLGVAICFDVNFPEVWQELADDGAEIVAWPSAYSAGEQLRAYALLHHYYIVTATHTGDSQVFDLTGEKLLDARENGILSARCVLDLDRGIYHSNFNDIPAFLRAQGANVALEKYMERESWYVLRAARPGVSARALAKQFGLEELRDYVGRSRKEINRRRGHAFPAARGSQTPSAQP